MPSCDPHKYFVDRESIQKSEFLGLLARFESSIPPELQGHVTRMAFVLFRPDAYLRGLVPPILDAFNKHGVYLARHHLLELDDAQVDSLYMFAKRKYATTWWIAEKLYKLGPSIPCLMVGQHPGYEHLSMQVRDLIGPTTPLVGQPEQIRSGFRGSNKVLNLVHAADDPASSFREALVFFDLETMCEVLTVASALCDQSVSVGTGGISGSAIHNLMPPQVAELRSTTVMHCIKERVLKTALGLESEYVEQLGPHLRCMSRSLGYEHGVLTRGMSLARERRALTEPLASEEALATIALQRIAALAQCLGRRRLLSDQYSHSVRSLQVMRTSLEVIRILSSQSRLTDSDFENDVLVPLASLGIDLDPYTEVVLQSSWVAAPEEAMAWELGQDK